MKVVETGDYIISSKSAINLYGYIYNEAFNPYDPEANLIAKNDDGCDKDQFKLARHLHVNTTYVLVITTIYSNIKGNFSIIIYGPNNIIFNRTSKYLYY